MQTNQSRALHPLSGLGPQEAVFLCLCDLGATLVAQSVKNPPAMKEATPSARDHLQCRSPRFDPWKWQSTQDSCLGNPMDRGAWQATDARVARVRHDSATKPPPPPMIPGPGTRHLKSTSNPKPAEIIHTSQS